MDKKIWYIHTMECYLAIEGNEILIHVTTWINREAIVYITLFT